MLKYEFFPKRGGGSRPNQKFWGTFFLPQNRQKGGGVRANPKVLRQFWGSFEADLGQFWGKIFLIWPPLGRRPGKIWICEANSRIFPVPSAKGWAFYFLSVFFFPQYDHLEGAHSFAQFLGQIFRLRGFWCKSRNTYRDRFYTLGRCSNLAAKQPWR